MKTQKKKKVYKPYWRAWFKGSSEVYGQSGTEIASIDNLARSHPDHFQDAAYLRPRTLKTRMYCFEGRK